MNSYHASKWEVLVLKVLINKKVLVLKAGDLPCLMFMLIISLCVIMFLALNSIFLGKLFSHKPAFVILSSTEIYMRMND